MAENRKNSRISQPTPQNSHEHIWVMGRNAVSEALKHCSPRIKSFVVSKSGDATLKEIIEHARTLDLEPEYTERTELDRLLGSDSHQGVACALSGPASVELKPFIEENAEKLSSLVVALDQIEDPHNLGAIMRACECFGVSALLWSRNRGAGLSPVVSKISAGASLLVPLILVANLAEGLRKLKDNGWWIVGCEKRENYSLVSEFDFPEKSVLILGNEGQGIRPIIQKLLDFHVAIPQFGKIDSLNVSQAAAVLLYEASKKQRR